MDWATNRSENSEWIPLLTTKLHVARTRPNLLHRSRLTERLDEGLRARLTLIAAPAGFGKTTLLGEWCERSKQSVAWLSLDESDNSDARFWAYFIGALQRLQPGLGVSSLEALAQEQPIELALTPLINELASMSGEVALVLDDYHTIHLDSVHNSLSFFIERMPVQMHLFVAGRVDPPLQLTRLRARGELVEIRDRDLRFTMTEAAALLKGTSGLDLPQEEINEIVAETEGWGVGLQLTALAIRDDRTTGMNLTGDRYRYVVDYLFDEVLGRLPAEMQSFLLKTSILKRMNGPLCDVVTGDTDGERMIGELLKLNLFITPVEGEKGWYRYHALVARVLSDRFAQTSKDEVEEIHCRASQWYEDHGCIQESVEHLLEGNDHENAARLAERYAEKMLAGGKFDALLNWRKIFPEELVATRPRLALAFAWALLLTGEFEAVEHYVELGQRFVPPSDDGLADISGHVATLESALAGFHTGAPAAESEPEGETESTRESLINELKKGIPRGPNATLYRKTAVQVEEHAVDVAVAEAPPETERFSLQEALPRVARLQHTMGRLSTAASTYRQVLDLMEDRSIQEAEYARTAAECFIGLGMIYYEWNALDKAMRNLSEGLKLSKIASEPALIRDAYALLAQLHQSRGDLDGAIDAIDDGEQLLRKGNAPFQHLASLAPCRVRIWLAQGTMQNAALWAQGWRMEDFTADSMHGQLMQARVLIAQYKGEEAAERITPVLQAAERKGWTDLIIRGLTLLSLALDQQGEAEQAITTLQRAIAMAEPERYIRTIIGEGAPMTRLLKKMRVMQESSEGGSANAPSREYIDTLLRSLGVFLNGEQENGTRNGSGMHIHGTPSPVALLTPISDREIEVLKLIADGKSNASIADTLYISVSTVKTHINNLYSKLGVESRTQALARAKEFNLI